MQIHNYTIKTAGWTLLILKGHSRIIILIWFLNSWAYIFASTLTLLYKCLRHESAPPIKAPSLFCSPLPVSAFSHSQTRTHSAHTLHTLTPIHQYAHSSRAQAHTHSHNHSLAHAHTHTHTTKHTHIQPWTQTHTYTHTNTPTHTRTRTNKRTPTQAQTHKHNQTPHIYSHAHNHTHIQTHTLIHTHTDGLH